MDSNVPNAIFLDARDIQKNIFLTSLQKQFYAVSTH